MRNAKRAIAALRKELKCGACAPQISVGDPCVVGDGNVCGKNMIYDRLTLTCQTYVASGRRLRRALPSANRGRNAWVPRRARWGVCTASATMPGATCDSKLATGPGCSAEQGLRCVAKTMTCVTLAFAAAVEACGAVNGKPPWPARRTGLCVIPTGMTSGLCMRSDGGRRRGVRFRVGAAVRAICEVRHRRSSGTAGTCMCSPPPIAAQ